MRFLLAQFFWILIVQPAPVAEKIQVYFSPNGFNAAKKQRRLEEKCTNEGTTQTVVDSEIPVAYDAHSCGICFQLLRSLWLSFLKRTQSLMRLCRCNWATRAMPLRTPTTTTIISFSELLKPLITAIIWANRIGQAGI